jgi:hypothetical protein
VIVSKNVYLPNAETTMEQNPEHNQELKQEVNRKFAELYHDIGSNREQLANKVIGIQRDIIKELARHPVDEQRKKEILNEVNRTIKMAAGQLPLRKGPPKPAVAAPVPAPPKSTVPKVAAPKNPVAKAPAPKAAPSAPAAKKTAKKTAPAKKKK